MTGPSANTLLRRLRVIVAEMTAEGRSDSELLDQFVNQRNEAAFAALMERHGGMVFGVCRQIVRDEHLAEDVFQATFLVLARNSATIRKRDGIGGWLHGVALRLSRKAMADAARAKRPDGRHKTGSTDEPPSALSWREVRTILDDELHRLPEKQRLALLGCLWEGRTVDEAAAHLGWAPGQVKGHLQRGRTALRARLIRRGVALSVLAAMYCADAALASAVPPLLTVATLKVATAFAAGEALSVCGASSSVIAITKQGLGLFSAAKARLVALVLFAVGIGAGVLAISAFAPQPHLPPPLLAKNDIVPRPAQEVPIKGRPTLTVQAPQEKSVLAMMMSPDGKWLISGGADGTAGFWEVGTGNLVRSFKERGEAIQCLALSKDRKWLACGCNSYQGDAAIARVWELDTGKQVYELKGHTAAVTSVSFSDDGKSLATGGRDKTARLWSLAAGQEVRVFRHDAPVTCVTLSPDGKRLVTGSVERPARLWDVESGKEIEAFRDGDASGLLAVSGDGQRMATALNKVICVWDLDARKLLRSFPITDDIRQLQISSDGKFLATIEKELLSDKRLLQPRALRLWDLTPRAEINSFRVEGAGDTMALSSDGVQVAVTSTTKPSLGRVSVSMVMWDMVTGKQSGAFPAVTREQCRDLAITSDGRWLATTSVGAVQVWDLARGKQSRSWKSEMTTANQAVALSSDGKCLVAGDALWDTAEGKLIREFPQQVMATYRGFTRVYSAAISNDNQFLVSVSGKWSKNNPDVIQATAGYVFDLKSGQRARVFTQNGPVSGHPIYKSSPSRFGVASASLTADGASLVTGGVQDGKARMWSVSTTREVRVFSGPANSDTYLALTGDDKYLAATHGADHDVLLWDLATGKEIRSFHGHTGPVCSIAFSTDGTRLVTGGEDRSVRLWDVATGKELHAFRGHTGRITKVALTDDAKRLVTSSLDETVRVWDAEAGKELCQLMSFTSGAWAVLDADGRFDGSSNGNADGLHWVVGNETFPLSRFKDRYYDPGLLAKHMGFDQEPLRRLVLAK